MKNLITVDDLFGQIKSKIKPVWVCAFLGCVIAGFLIHLYPMTNHFLNNDSLWNQYSDQDIIASGRQFLTYACSIGSYYDLHWLNGVLSLLYLGITAVMLVEIFGIKDKVFAAIAGILLVSFPSFVATYSYAYTVDGYMLAVLLATLAYLLTKKYKWGFLPGMVCMGVSLGIYQAYFSWTILLCIMGMLLEILREDNMKKILVHGMKCLGMGLGGYVFYVITLKLMLLLKGAEVSGYQGSDRVLGYSLSLLPKGLLSAGRSFGSFLFVSNVLTANIFMKVALVILIAVAVGLFGYLFIKRKAYRQGGKILLVAVLCVMIPFGANLINIMNPDVYFHLLMRYPWVIFFLFVPVLLEEGLPELKSASGKMKKLFAQGVLWGGTLALVVMIFCFAVNGNIAYFSLNERYEKSYALALRMLDRMEEHPDYTPGMTVAVLGGFPNKDIFPTTDNARWMLRGYFGDYGEYVIDSTDKYAAFWARYMGVTVNYLTTPEELELVKTKEFEEMGLFPAEDCIRKVGDVLIIKINE
ncbi:MAG: glucosyltransferase domain-containing protein [Lachnospiraceae bacterium]|nr:glucosyltransferase domain-containing protein [Lachnospiraceae bacterium]